MNQPKHKLTPEQYDELSIMIFGGQTIDDTSKSLDAMFFQFLASEAAEDNQRRSEVLVSYGILKNLLSYTDQNYVPGRPLTLNL